ncbi:pirin family protein [Aliivibrio kagoshimensis]|uniref:pirin family protein n=1 Tax=Aliivibrio kagoshimensis TaxID=2910230 RepID=UPI003D0B8636
MTALNLVRSISDVFTARDSHDGDGVKLKRVFSFQPHTTSASLDPFLLLDEFSSDNPNDYIGGFPEHPHRGFETVTYMIEGLMEHRDHLGNIGRLTPGSVQWMTAGKGVLHSEMPKQEAGLLRGLQLWVNLPAERKMQPAAYQEFSAEEMPLTTLNNGTSVKAIAGNTVINQQEIEGVVTQIATQALYLDMAIPINQQVTIDVPASHTVLTYLLEGEYQSPEGKVLQAHQMAKWKDGDQVTITATEHGARLIFLSGEPINEPVVHYGPFVMNTSREIDQAISDFQNGTLTD